MKNGQTDFIVDRFTIVDKTDDTDVIAVREKVSVQIDENRKTVNLHDYTYTFDEIIAVADKLKSL